jgi:hypothetical protein
MTVLLGFDARELWIERSRGWPDARRAQYLLRPDVEKPFSVDVIVWPTIFRDDQVEMLHLGSDVGVGGLPRPQWVGPHGLSTNLEELQSRARACARAFATIAVVARTHPLAAECAALETSPAKDWASLGFDVADEYLLSGLMNCGYDDEHPDAKARFASKLNKHHLFITKEDAEAFVGYSNDRVREHAPFFAYEIRIAPGWSPLP